MHTLDSDAEGDEGMSMTCSVRRVSLTSMCPSYAEYVCSCLDVTAAASPLLYSALWRAANRYLWARGSEDELRAALRAELDASLPGVTDAFVSALLRELRQRRLEYFSRQWANIDSVVAVAAADYQRWRCAPPAPAPLQQVPSSNALEPPPRLPLVSLEQWDRVRTTVHDTHLLLVVVAPFCALCNEVRPALRAVAASSAAQGLLVCKIDGAVEGVAAALAVSRVPCVELWFGGQRLERLLIESVHDVDVVVAWVARHAGKVVAAPTTWRSLFSDAELSALRASMRAQRHQSSVRETIKAMGCLEPEHCHRLGERSDAPTVILMGGGVASGKTAVAAALHGTPFWRKHGARVVVVEADRFKEVDPLMDHIVQRGAPPSFAAQAVHRESTDAAETLLLQALTNQRDIIFDGTLKWRPFVEQTVAMLRDCHQYHYTRGPGYRGPDDEQYWVRGERRATARLPYRIWVVAAYCSPVVSVGRSIRRAVLHQRGVSLDELLRSHKMFAAHFASYVELVDTVTLYDNSKSRSRHPSAAAQLPVIAEKRLGGSFHVHDPVAYAQFNRCATLNVAATSARQLFDSTAPQCRGVEELEEHAAPAQPLVVELLAAHAASKL